MLATVSDFLKQSIEKISKNYLIICGGIAVFLISILVFYGLLSAPIADDWGFFTSVKKHDLFKFIEICMKQTGRITQWLVIYVGFATVGMKAVKILPILLIIGLIWSIYFLVGKFKIISEKQTKIKTLIFSSLIAASIIFTLPSLFDSFLWYDSSALYIVSVIFMFINLGLIYDFIVKESISYKKLIMFVTCLIFGQVGSEPISMFMIGIGGLIFLGGLIYKNQQAIKRSLISLLFLIHGFLLVFLSPGSVARRQSSPKFDWQWVFIDSFKTYRKLFIDPKIWLIFGIIVFVTTCIFISKRAIKLKNWQLISLAVVSFLATTYPIFVINNYTQSYVPYRVLTLSSVGVIVTIIMLALLFVKNLKTSLNYGWLCLALIFMLPPIAYYSSLDLERLSLRNKMVKIRDIRTRQAKIDLEKGKNVQILTAPSLMRGDAEDFYYADGGWNKNGRIWVANNYLNYMGIDENLPKERIELVDPQENYW